MRIDPPVLLKIPEVVNVTIADVAKFDFYVVDCPSADWSPALTAFAQVKHRSCG